MIICTRCGERNPPGQEFCVSCGEYLEWDAAAAPPAGPPNAAPSRDVGRPPAGSAGPPGTPATPGAGGGAAGVYRVGPVPNQAAQGYVGPPPVQGNQAPYRPGPAGAGPAGVGPQPGPPGLAQPGPNVMQPTDVQRRRNYTPVPDAPVVNPGDIVCRSCGSPNEPDRRFCKLCGTPLTAAPMGYGPRPQVKLGWWRRHFGRNNPQPNMIHQAGDRPTLQRSRRWPRWVAFIVALAAIAGVGYVGNERHWISSLKSTISDKVGKPTPFVPDRMTASSQASGHGPALAIDGISNKFWAPSGGRTAGQFIEAHFPQPFRLLDIDVTGGVDTDQAKYLAQERPDAIVITVTDSSGKVSTFTRTLQDKAGPQPESVTAANVVSVRLTIQSVYGAAPGRLVGVAEVEFFGKS